MVNAFTLLFFLFKMLSFCLEFFFFFFTSVNCNCKHVTSRPLLTLASCCRWSHKNVEFPCFLCVSQIRHLFLPVLLQMSTWVVPHRVPYFVCHSHLFMLFDFIYYISIFPFQCLCDSSFQDGRGHLKRDPVISFHLLLGSLTESLKQMLTEYLWKYN
jgi:hypothetical protein